MSYLIQGIRGSCSRPSTKLPGKLSQFYSQTGVSVEFRHQLLFAHFPESPVPLNYTTCNPSPFLSLSQSPKYHSQVFFIFAENVTNNCCLCLVNRKTIDYQSEWDGDILRRKWVTRHTSHVTRHIFEPHTLRVTETDASTSW